MAKGQGKGREEELEIMMKCTVFLISLIVVTEENRLELTYSRSKYSILLKEEQIKHSSVSLLVEG